MLAQAVQQRDRLIRAINENLQMISRNSTTQNLRTNNRKLFEAFNQAVHADSGVDQASDPMTALGDCRLSSKLLR